MTTTVATDTATTARARRRRRRRHRDQDRDEHRDEHRHDTGTQTRTGGRPAPAPAAADPGGRRAGHASAPPARADRGSTTADRTEDAGVWPRATRSPPAGARSNGSAVATATRPTWPSMTTCLRSSSPSSSARTWSPTSTPSPACAPRPDARPPRSPGDRARLRRRPRRPSTAPRARAPRGPAALDPDPPRRTAAARADGAPRPAALLGAALPVGRGRRAPGPEAGEHDHVGAATADRPQRRRDLDAAARLRRPSAPTPTWPRSSASPGAADRSGRLPTSGASERRSIALRAGKRPFPGRSRARRPAARWPQLTAA